MWPISTKGSNICHCTHVHTCFLCTSKDWIQNVRGSDLPSTACVCFLPRDGNWRQRSTQGYSNRTRAELLLCALARGRERVATPWPNRFTRAVVVNILSILALCVCVGSAARRSAEDVVSHECPSRSSCRQDARKVFAIIISIAITISDIVCCWTRMFWRPCPPRNEAPETGVQAESRRRCRCRGQE